MRSVPRACVVLSLCCLLTLSGRLAAEDMPDQDTKLQSLALDLDGPLHIETQPRQRVHVEINSTVVIPEREVTVWGAVMGFPVDGCGQFQIQGRMVALDRNGAEAVLEHEPGGIHQPLLVIKYPAYQGEQSGRFLATYDLSMSNRKLVAGKPAISVRPLSDEVRAWSLRSNKFTNFDEPHFQTWIKEHDLVRSSGERDVKFAYRALGILGKLLKYGTAGPQDACSVISQGGSECGGLSNTYVAVLRANGIPARLIPGRWLGKAKPEMDSTGALDFDRTTIHCKSEFYATGIGWVPVMAVPTGGASTESSFGIDNGDFLALSFDDFEYPYGGGSGNFAKFYGASAGNGSWNGFKVIDRLTWRKVSDAK